MTEEKVNKLPSTYQIGDIVLHDIDRLGDFVGAIPEKVISVKLIDNEVYYDLAYQPGPTEDVDLSKPYSTTKNIPSKYIKEYAR